MIMQPFPAKTRKRVKFMSYTKIAAIYADSEALSGQTVTVGGWVRTIRDMKTFGFIELNDGSCFKNLQVVMEAGTLENYKDIAAQNVGAALIVTGTVVLTPEAKQPLELKAASIEVEGTSTSDYPLQKKRHSVEFLRTIQHLRPRTNLFSAVFRVRSVAAYAIHQFFQERGFVYVHTPIITASDCEGAGEMFRVTTLDPKNPPMTEDGEVDFSQDFFGKPANLTVSGQLNAENFAMAFGDVYTFGPTFRAENSNTQRHAAEFWMIEPEMAFTDLKGDMDVAEAMIKFVIRQVMEKCPQELACLTTRSPGAATCRRNTSGISPSRCTRSRCSSRIIPRRSRRSTCASTTMGKPWPRRTAWYPASARSSAAASARSGWKSWKAASGSWA